MDLVGCHLIHANGILAVRDIEEDRVVAHLAKKHTPVGTHSQPVFLLEERFKITFRHGI